LGGDMATSMRIMEGHQQEEGLPVVLGLFQELPGVFLHPRNVPSNLVNGMLLLGLLEIKTEIGSSSHMFSKS